MDKTFSIIIPAGKDAKVKFLKNCLQALSKQTFQDFEIIIVADKNTIFRLKKVINKYPEVRHINAKMNKSQARNLGAKHAKGKYFLHIDVDYILPPNILEKCFKVLRKKREKIIILRENVAASKNIWQKARHLEKTIIAEDKNLSAPQLIERKLFEKIKGFDEKVDALDDWVLNLKLKKEGVKAYEIATPLTLVYEPTNIVEVIKRRFHKGRSLSGLRKYYGDPPQTNVASTIQLYLSNLDQITKQPLSFLALIVLKFFDLISFYLGSFNPPQGSEPCNIYQQAAIAEGFDKEQMSIYARYKHYREVKALLRLLSPATSYKLPDTILELGCGTGRITQELIQKGYRVTPTDISLAMLKVYKTKLPGLPKPTLLKPGKLPFPTNKFDHVIAIRVIWHILDKKERELFLKEAIRVAKESVIMDFAMKNRGLNRFFTIDYYFTEEEIEKLAKRLGAKIADTAPLPLGRLLIKITKK